MVVNTLYLGDGIKLLGESTAYNLSANIDNPHAIGNMTAARELREDGRRTQQHRGMLVLQKWLKRIGFNDHAPAKAKRDENFQN